MQTSAIDEISASGRDVRQGRTSARFLIVGGGAGGLELAIRLARGSRRAEVTLADSSPSHIWKPRLHEIAVGLLVSAEEQVGYAEQAAAHDFTFVLGAVESLDAGAGAARVGAVREPDGSAELLPQRTLRFDTAVLAIGSTINDFGIPGVAEHCYTLDTAEGSERLHRRLLAQCARVQAGEQERIGIAIVGAGTTGVELAAELSSAIHRLPQYRSLIDRDRVDITLLEKADRPLPGVATDTSDYANRLLTRQRVKTRFGADVTAVEAGVLRLANGDVVSADILVWASGIKARSLKLEPAPTIEKSGRMRVDPMLRLVREDGQALTNVYALGDCGACFEQGHDTPVGATAQAAQQEARLLARSLLRQMRGRAPLAFHFRYRGTLVSLGSGTAVGDVPAGRASIRVAGLTAKLAYLALYRMHLVTLFGWTRTGALTIASLLRRSATPAVKLHW